MPATAIDLTRLSVSERLQLLEDIWDSLPEEMTPDAVPARHLEVLESRLAEAEANPGIGEPWRDFLDRIEMESP